MEKKHAWKASAQFRFFDTILRRDAGPAGRTRKTVAQAMNLLIVVGGYTCRTPRTSPKWRGQAATYFIKNAGGNGIGQAHPSL